MFGPWAVRAVVYTVACRCVCRLYLILGLSSVVMQGYDFRQVRGNGGHAGVIHKIVNSRVAGAYPPNMQSKEGIILTPRAPRSTALFALTKKNVVRARHGLRAPCQRVRIEFEAGWGTWEHVPRARFVYTPI